MSLASKLPYDHPYAGGFSGIGSQPLPTDTDALDYLARVKAADGAGVETGVAVALDAFFRGLKATPGLFDAIKASCILCGARTITGALVPLAGDAPSPEGGWASGDYSRTAGLTGDGNALYLDSNRSGDADPKNDNHVCAYVTASASANSAVMGNGNSLDGLTQVIEDINNTSCFFRNNSSASGSAFSPGTGLVGCTRSNASNVSAIGNGSSGTLTIPSAADDASNINIFARRNSNLPQLHWDGTAAFYSIGTDIGAAGLTALDTAVTNLITAIGEAL